MKTSFELTAEFRETQGKGASRRLRHEGKVPAILYGGHLGGAGVDLEPSEARDHARERALLLDDPEPARRRSDAGRDPEGRAAASVQERDPAHRFSARRGEREDPHQHSAALQGRGGLAGREVAGRHRVAHAYRGRGGVPAEGSAGVHRGRPFGTFAQREHPSVAAEDPGGRAARRSREGRLRGRRDSQPACRGARADGGGSGRRGGARRRRGRRGSGGTGGSARAMRRRRRRPRRRTPRRNRRRKTRRSNPRVLDRGAARIRRPFIFFGRVEPSSARGQVASTMAGLPLRIIVGLGNPGPEHLVTRHNAGFWFVDLLARRHGAEFRDYRKFSGETARISIGGPGYRAIEAHHLHESQRLVGAAAERFLQGSSGGDPGRAR